jgi:GntR family transcriptional repressor for pyruvate dehydrogenase complex
VSGVRHTPQPEEGRQVEEPEVVPGKPFRTVRKTRASEEIIEQIRDLIASGRLKVGDRLPAERELASLLTVGRSTVREAIRALESLGIVQVRAGEGTFLIANPADQPGDPLTSRVFSSLHNQHLLFEVRTVIEPDLAALAARRASFDQIVKMREILQEQEALIQRGDSGIVADTQFHYLLAEAAGNEILFNIMNGLMDLLRETRQASLQTSGRPARSVKQHRAVLRAIEMRDPKGAEQRMREHLEEMQRVVLEAAKAQAATPATPSTSGREGAPA